MLLCLCLACAIDNPDDGAPASEFTVTTHYERHQVRTCAVIAEDSPHAPDRLVFLYKTDPNQTETQVELYGFDASRLRCGTMDLHLREGSDRTQVVVDFMPPADTVKLTEFRVYDLGVAWDPENPFAIAVEDHRPSRDYVFGVNRVSPPDDASVLLLAPR